jgi:recombination protein RecA
VSDSLKALLADISKKEDYRLGRLDEVGVGVEAISTGNMAIDHIIGVGGLPLGRSVELYGPPSSGKTTAALQTAATFQRLNPDRSIVYFDYEQSVDPEYCASLGLNIEADSFIFGQPDVFEQSMNSLDRLLPTNEIGLVIFDSVASMTPREVLEDSVDKAGVAQQARLMAKALARLNSQLAHANCCAIWLNHVGEVISIGGRPGMPPRKTTPGGKALKFYASVRLEFNQIGNTTAKLANELSGEEETVVTATRVKVKVVKNKVGAPFKTCMVQVEFGKGFSNFFSAQQILTNQKVVVGTGGYFYFDEKNGAGPLIHADMETQTTGNHRRYIKGAANLLVFATDHPEWAEAFCALAVSLIGTPPIPGAEVEDEILADPLTGEMPASATEIVEGAFGGAESSLDDLLANSV